MTQLNLKLAEIVPEKIVVIDGKQYLILGENKSTTEKAPKAEKTDTRRKGTKEDKQKRLDAIMAVVRDNPGLTKQEIIPKVEEQFNIVLTSSLWNNDQTRLKNKKLLRSEWVNNKQPWDGARYYIIPPIDPELQRILDEEDAIERAHQAYAVGSTGPGAFEPEDPANKAYREFSQEATAMHLSGKTNLEIADHFGINEATVRQTLSS